MLSSLQWRKRNLYSDVKVTQPQIFHLLPCRKEWVLNLLSYTTYSIYDSASSVEVCPALPDRQRSFLREVHIQQKF